VGGVVGLDVEALAGELRRWMGDEKLRGESARKAQAFVREWYDWEKIAARWGEHYARMSGATVSRVDAAPTMGNR
jgi:glycosyltransferase involved in cell wall biosynthesis